MIPTTLVAGAGATQREQEIAGLLDASVVTAVILEGLPAGEPALTAGPSLVIARIAAGCPCCAGNLVLRVTLQRMLRNNPSRLYIGLAADAHLDALRNFLSAPPYANLLELTKEIRLDNRSR